MVGKVGLANGSDDAEDREGSGMENKMKTVSVQIGNSDDKLTQKQWADFVTMVGSAILGHGGQVHFFGGAANWMTWQNVAWVFECDEQKVDVLKKILADIGRHFRQDSVAWLEGETEFLRRDANWY